jgi:hypothetical protein
LRNKTFFSLAFFWIYVSNSFRQKLDKCVGLKNNPAQRKTVTGREDASFSVPDLLRPAQRPVRCWDVGGCIACILQKAKPKFHHATRKPGKLEGFSRAPVFQSHPSRLGVENSNGFCVRVFHGVKDSRT